MKLSIGNITKSILYISVQPTKYGKRLSVSFGKTFVGTVAGLFVFAFGHSLMAHIRNPFFDYSKV